MELRKNCVVSGIITDLNSDAQGVLKTKTGEVVFVPYALTGEEISAQIINTKSKFAIGKLTEIKNASSSRTEPICPYFYKCGGCDLMHTNQATQLKYKTNKVKNCFSKIAGIDIDVKPCINLNSLRYRNKIALPVSENGEIGLYRKNSHNVLPIEDCKITQEWNKTLIDATKEYIHKTGVSCYNETTKTGLIKHIVARKINNSILITLVINGKNLPHLETLVDILKQRFDSFGLNLNLNRLNNNVILAPEWANVYGLKELTATEFGVTYPVSNASFYQVNDEIKKAIYTEVLNNINPSSVVIDAYSGAGLLSGIISKHCKKCYGVEIVPEATENANKLKSFNHLKNLENINGDCAKIIPELIKTLNTEEIIVTLDPPRKGCDKKVLDAIILAKPNKIIYISCDPATLARDCKIVLSSNNYSISLVQPFDMFPNTKHVETLVILNKI